MASQIKQSIEKNCSQNGDQEVIEALIADQISSSKILRHRVGTLCRSQLTRIYGQQHSTPTKCCQATLKATISIKTSTKQHFIQHTHKIGFNQITLSFIAHPSTDTLAPGDPAHKRSLFYRIMVVNQLYLLFLL